MMHRLYLVEVRIACGPTDSTIVEKASAYSARDAAFQVGLRHRRSWPPNAVVVHRVEPWPWCSWCRTAAECEAGDADDPVWMCCNHCDHETPEFCRPLAKPRTAP